MKSTPHCSFFWVTAASRFKVKAASFAEDERADPLMFHRDEMKMLKPTEGNFPFALKNTFLRDPRPR